MTKRDWAILGCRILAMYLFVWGVSLLLQHLGLLGWPPWRGWGSWDEMGFDWMRLLVAAGPIVTIIFACVLWCLAPRLPGRLLSGATEAELPAGGAAGGLDRRGAMEVAFVILGMFLLAKGLSWLAVGIYSAVTGASRGLDWTRVLFIPVEAVVLVILGLCLVAGGRGIAALVAGVRTAGVAPGDAPVDDLERQTVWRPLAFLALLLVAGMLILVAIAVGAWFAGHVRQMPV